MFDGINCFGLRLLMALVEQKGSGEVAISPPALYLPLALLRGVSSGATRAGLSRALGSSESLTDEEREHRIRTLRGILNSERFFFETSLAARRDRPFSTAFLRRAQDIYGLSVQADDTPLPLRLGAQLTVPLKLEGRVGRTEADRLTGLRLPAVEGRRCLYILVPPRATFWQNKQKPLLSLLERLDDTYLWSWQERLTEVEHQALPADELPALPQLAETQDFLELLKKMDMGPAFTQAADFSLMMVAGEAPYLSALRQTLQLRITGVETSPDVYPLLWWLTDEPSGLRIALGVCWGLTD